MIEANRLGTLNGVSTVLRQMKAAKTGTIIDDISSSIAGFKAFANHYAAYCATKYGVDRLTETVSLEALQTTLESY